MKKTIIKLNDKLNDFSLLKKIMLLVLIILIMTSSCSILGFWLIFSSGNKMLYKSLAGSLTHSASNISKNLENLETMTAMMLSDNTIQTTLSVVADVTDDSKRNDAYRTLTYLVPDYYQNFKQYGISYMNLYNSDYTVYSYLSRSNKTPDYVHDQAIVSAHGLSGRPVWTTDYCNSYGLYLSRDIRRASQLRLDTLGTVVVAVDLEKVIAASTKDVFQSGTAEYIVYKDDNEIYHTPALNKDALSELKDAASSVYGVIRLNHSYYFYVNGVIPKYNWSYMCLVPYQSIAEAQKTYFIVSVLIILFIFIFSLLMSKRFIRSITIHFSRLITKMDDFGKDESILPVSDYNYSNMNNEIGELHRKFDQMAAKVQDLIQINYVNELLTKEARLKALENQINPHFLYNTLESLNWHAKAIGSKEISVIVEALGSLLRTTLNNRETHSTLRSELKIVSDYMAIIKIRFDERIQYDLDIPDELYDMVLPQLTLQPLIENAVKYAVEESTEPCNILISGSFDETNVIIKIINSGSEFPYNLLQKLEQKTIQPHGFGIGLLNIHNRLQLHFGTEYGLSFYNDDMDHAVVQITLPPMMTQHNSNPDKGVNND